MKLAMKEALQELADERKKVPCSPRVTVSRQSEKFDGSYVDANVRHRVSYAAIFRTNMLVDDVGEALTEAHKQAERMMMHEVYGPVRDELREILFLLWEEGIDGPIKDRLQALEHELA